MLGDLAALFVANIMMPIRKKESMRMMRSRLRVMGICFIVIFIIIGSVPLKALAEDVPEEHILTVAFPEAPGIHEVYDNGTYGGATYDALMEIAKYTGWKYEFVTGNAGQLLNGMMNGEYDLMGGMFYQAEWEKYYGYSKYVMGKSYSALLCRSDNQTAKNFDLTTINGMTIGVYSKAVGKVQRLQNYLTFNNIDCELRYYDVLSEYQNCLENNETDLILGNVTDAEKGYVVIAEFESDPYYIVTNKNRPELNEQLNEALTEIYAANPRFADELYEKYFTSASINPIDFSKRDKDFIRTAPTIRVAVVKKRHPLYYEKEGVSYGIIPDVFQLLANRTGLHFTYVLADNYQQAVDMVKNGEADLAGDYMGDSYEAEAAGLSLTKNYASLDAIILKNKTVTYPSDGLTMAVPIGRTMQNPIENGKVKYWDNYADCLAAVNAGEADFIRIPSAFLESLYLQDSYPNITITASETMEAPLTIALAAPVNIQLYSVLTKAINNLSPDEITDILSKNMISMGERDISLKTFIYANPLPVLAVVVGFFALLLFIVLLSARFRLKNKVMKLRMEKVEETAREKSEFLSRMSHEIRTPMNAIIGLTSLTQMSCELSPEAKRNLEKIDSSAQFLLSLVNDILDMSKIDSNKMIIQAAPFNLDAILKQMDNIFTLQAQQKGITFSIQKVAFDSQQLLGDEVRIKQVLTNLLSNACKFTDAGGNITLNVTQVSANEQEKELRFCVSDTGIGIAPEDTSRIFNSFEQVSFSRRNAQGTGLGLSISSRLVGLMGSKLQVESTPGEGSDFYFTLRLPVCREVKAEEGKQKSAAEPTLDGMRVLLAEDNDLNAEIAGSILELKGVRVERARDGQQAVEAFFSRPAGWFHLILMDIQMPVKDGLTACREIRSGDRSDAGTIPIIAMTANTFQEDRDNAAAAGMNGFIPKPFNVEQLYEALGDAHENDT